MPRVTRAITSRAPRIAGAGDLLCVLRPTMVPQLVPCNATFSWQSRRGLRRRFVVLRCAVAPAPNVFVPEICSFAGVAVIGAAFLASFTKLLGR